MPRALTIQRTLVTPPERERFHERLRRKKAYYVGANCQFWVFEEASLPGAFLEFFEAQDAETLARAHAGAPEPVLDPNRVYTEVEFR
ncbi:MAG TPA: hypothetical protein VHV78_11065 [Gemmatimonadaceae bacterium]|jgi:hypothetical protein|nr:hypothetical protein [Gemmatimonadaceae bacterium]